MRQGSSFLSGEVADQERERLDPGLEVLHPDALVLAVGADVVTVDGDAADAVCGNASARTGSAMPLRSLPFASCRIGCRFLHQHPPLRLPIDLDRQCIRVELAPEGGEFFSGQFVHEPEG